jgi:isochorismate synthase
MRTVGTVNAGAGISAKINLNSIISLALAAGKSISLWRLPDGVERYLVVADAAEKIDASYSLEDSPPGFLVAPFDRSSPRYFLPADELYIARATVLEQLAGVEKIIETAPGHAPFHLKVPSQRNGHPQNSYEKLVENCVDEISKGTFEKIVPARSHKAKIDPAIDLLDVFDRLSTLYPQAFVSLTSSASYGTWIGASPELLVHVDPSLTFKTAAMAATQPFSDTVDLKKISWAQKEIEEQALVERYIISCFKKIRLREYDEHGPRTVRAGNLLHLKTDFSVDMRATNFPQLGTVMLQLLHPTSAVCGMPLEPALQFLKQHEDLDRELYSGFLGPVGILSDTQLYVNLRCMQLLPGSEAAFYAGAGVTIDSSPSQEWEETVMKMNTLRRVIVS